MSNVPCRMSNVLDQLTRRPNWVTWSFGQIQLTFDMGRLTFEIENRLVRRHHRGALVGLAPTAMFVTVAVL